MIFIISRICLVHKGGYYQYRVCNRKTDHLCKNFSSLKNYLKDMLKNCPHEYFNSGPRSSSLKFKIPKLEPQEIIGHEVSSLTRQALKINEERFKTSHSKVQVYLLENDNKTIAVEVPIWLKNSELKNYKTLFKTNDILTGHIDLLSIEHNKVWVWDYKPNANREKYASTQTFFYSLMLSKRTNISLENFRCGYFDKNYCYIFKPINFINFIKNQLLLV